MLIIILQHKEFSELVQRRELLFTLFIFHPFLLLIFLVQGFIRLSSILYQFVFDVFTYSMDVNVMH